ncbi:hypothetical protein [Nocardia sp. NPDC002869]|uniref:hypothetical protein n=1 Tax=Nocardia sp. NPDC002869 TaxID=3161032 RepID=UPI00398CD26F
MPSAPWRAAGNPDSAHLIGVPVGRMLMIGWGPAAAIGALAASLAAPQRASLPAAAVRPEVADLLAAAVYLWVK